MPPPKNWLSIQFGTRIKTERERRGLTQAELAEQMGIDRQTVFRIESGGSFTAENVQDLANAFGWEIKALFDFDEPPPKGTGLSGKTLAVAVLLDELAERNPRFASTVRELVRQAAKLAT